MLRNVLLIGSFLFLLSSTVLGNSLLAPGIVRDSVELKAGYDVFVGFPHASFNGTEVEIRLHCNDFDGNYEYEAQFVIRSSPCDKEFFDARRKDTVQGLLQFYFENKDKLPAGYNYDKIVHYQSAPQKFLCKSGTEFFLSNNANMTVVKIKSTGTDAATRTKRQPGLNGGGTIDGGAKKTLTSWHPAVNLPVDGIYFLVVRLRVAGTETTPKETIHNVTVEAEWRGPRGYLSAVDYPLLPFYGIMCIVYGIMALAWFIVSVMYWKDLLRIQFWIGAVILLGMVEKAVFYAEYQTMNATGESVEGAIELAELVSCLKRTLARMLIIIVSVGFGVVKPRLGSTLHQVVGVGFVYFILCAIEGVMRVSKNRPEAAKQKQLAALPLVLLEVGIFWWIFTALVNTMRALRLRRNEVKLSLYRHFTNTLCIAVLASVAFMFWSLYEHVFTDCLRDWTELWVDTAFWHVLFCAILVVIMFLWRPSNNNQRYAFTPLLDNSEDENDDDEIFNSDAFVTEAMKLHQKPSETKAENRKQRDPDQALKEELKWVEENIPSSMADKLIADSDEDAEATHFELSKMQ